MQLRKFLYSFLGIKQQQLNKSTRANSDLIVYTVAACHTLYITSPFDVSVCKPAKILKPTTSNSNAEKFLTETRKF